MIFKYETKHKELKKDFLSKYANRSCVFVIKPILNSGCVYDIGCLKRVLGHFGLLIEYPNRE